MISPSNWPLGYISVWQTFAPRGPKVAPEQFMRPYLMPSICPVSFPSPMKMDPVRVRTPLSFLGDDSPRYMRCTFSPRPVINNQMRRKKAPKSLIASGPYWDIPILYPERNLPRKIISNDLALRLKIMSSAATTATTLLNKSVFFLKKPKQNKACQSGEEQLI